MTVVESKLIVEKEVPVVNEARRIDEFHRLRISVNVKHYPKRTIGVDTLKSGKMRMNKVNDIEMHGCVWVRMNKFGENQRDKRARKNECEIITNARLSTLKH